MAPEEVATAFTRIRALETSARGASCGTAQSEPIGSGSSAGKRRREPEKEDEEGGCGASDAVDKERTASGAADSVAAVHLSTGQLRKLGSPHTVSHEHLLSEMPSESGYPDLSRPLLEWRVEAVCVRVGHRVYRVPLS